MIGASASAVFATKLKNRLSPGWLERIDLPPPLEIRRALAPSTTAFTTTSSTPDLGTTA